MIQLSSFLLGVGAVLALPALTRIARPLIVEVVAAGMGMVQEATRVVAEQIENLEDIAAEAKAKREAEAARGLESLEDEVVEPEASNGGAAQASARARRRVTARHPSA